MNDANPAPGMVSVKKDRNTSAHSIVVRINNSPLPEQIAKMMIAHKELRWGNAAEQVAVSDK
jgi:hypothetical protein